MPCSDTHHSGRAVKPDEAWANAAKHYDDEQLAALVALIALINTYNRMNVITQQPAGDYQPGQWG
jgi:alkylhydroperoxidase family enzyme